VSYDAKKALEKVLCKNFEKKKEITGWYESLDGMYGFEIPSTQQTNINSEEVVREFRQFLRSCA